MYDISVKANMWYCVYIHKHAVEIAVDEMMTHFVIFYLCDEYVQVVSNSCNEVKIVAILCICAWNYSGTHTVDLARKHATSDPGHCTKQEHFEIVEDST